MELRQLEEMLTQSRREVLITLDDYISKGNLDGVVGTSPILDLALLAVAKDDPVMLAKLSSALDTDQLSTDIKHVRDSAELREKRKEVLQCAASTTKL